MTVRVRRITLLLAGLLVLLGFSSAYAAPSPVPATLSGLAVADQNVTGNLTLRPGQSTVDVDASSVRATIGGQPVKQLRLVKAASVGRTTMLVIDTSGSMGPTGMATVRAAVATFLRSVPSDVQVGVLSFANTAGVDLQPTLDRTRVQATVNALRSSGETALFSGMTKAAAALGKAGDRSILLLSDGGETIVPKAQQAAAVKPVIATLSASETRVEVVRFKTDETNDGVLQAFATAGGGSVARAENAAAVSAAFAAAAKALESQVRWAATTSSALTGLQPVVLQGTASGRPFSARATVDLGKGNLPSPPPTTTSTPTPAPTATTPLVGGVSGNTAAAGPHLPFTHVSLWLALAVLAMFLGLFGLVVAFVAPVFRSRRKERISAIELYTAGGATIQQAAKQANPSVVSEQLVHLGDKVMAGRESTSRTMELMDRADLPWRAGEWFVLRCTAILVGAVGFYLLLGNLGIFALLVGAVVGFAAPAVGLRFMARRRATRFESLLPDVLMLVATSLSTGFSLPQALDAVARDAAEPAAKEFSRALAETRIGADMPDALDHMALRMGSENLRWTVMAIRIQREVGGNLAETLRTTAKTLRERESLRRQVRALSAEGRLSAYILIALPIAIFLYSYFVNYDYVSLLWTGWMGRAMLAAGAIDMVVGIFWMRKVVQIEV